MRILMLNYEYPPLGGGAGPITQALAEHLAIAGHVTDVVTMGFQGLPHVETHGRLRIYRVPALRSSISRANTVEMLSYLISAIPWTLALTQHHRYDLIHTHFILPTSVISGIVGKLRGIPTVITIHGSDVPGYNPDRFQLSHQLLMPVWKVLARSADMIVSPSGYLRDLLQSHCQIPVEVIPHGFEQPPIQRATKRKRILFVGRLFPRKGAQFLLEALADLPLQDWEVIIAGDGPILPMLRNQAQHLGLNIQFPGFVKGAALHELYASSAIFVFPSLQENFPVVLLEAMSAGCAVITSNAGGMPEVVGDAGILTPPGDVGAIRYAIQQLTCNLDFCRAVGDKARKRINSFAWDKIINQHLSLYRQITNKTLPHIVNSSGKIG